MEKQMERPRPARRASITEKCSTRADCAVLHENFPAAVEVAVAALLLVQRTPEKLQKLIQKLRKPIVSRPMTLQPLLPQPVAPQSSAVCGVP